MPADPSQACINCHFLIKEINPHKFPLTSQNREAIRNRDFSWLHGGYEVLACHLGIWDEGYLSEPERRYEIIVQTNRQDRCFFWQYQPGMLLPAAVELQRREMERKMVGGSQSSNRNPWMSGSFYLAAGVMILALLLVVAKVLPLLVLPIVIVGTLLMISTIGAFQLRQDKGLSQKNFLALMTLTFR